MSDSDEIHVTEHKEKKPRKPITEKQRVARQANLAKGRETRRLKIAERKKQPKSAEYDLESSSDDEEVDMSSLILSKKKHKKPERQMKGVDDDMSSMRKEMQEMRSVMYEMSKRQRKKPRKQASTKIVLLPNQNQPAKEAPQYDANISQLLAAINKR